MDQQSAPVTMHIYCRVKVIVTDQAAVTRQAVAELRAADIDWSTEEDDLESAVEELRSDLAASVSDLVDISHLVEGIPGVEFRGGLCWTEQGPARDPFRSDEQ
ncbi:hypothetical protein ABZ403_04730 [Micromonospora zamorensis]|uniref:hypothetical protein n=1 Tax=Micromonospora zamorensis TaxID=709883 RepID=UPI0033C327C3